jgi:hypothetical protein
LKGKKCLGWYWSENVVEVYVYRLLPNDEAFFALAERLEETLLLGEDLAFDAEHLHDVTMKYYHLEGCCVLRVLVVNTSVLSIN